MIVLPARNGSKGPWLISDVFDLLDVRECPNGLSVVDRRRLEATNGQTLDGHYLAGCEKTRLRLRGLPVPTGILAAFYGAGGALIAGREFLVSEDLPDGFLFLCKRNADERDRRDHAIAIMVGCRSTRPLDDDWPVTAEWLPKCFMYSDRQSSFSLGFVLDGSAFAHSSSATERSCCLLGQFLTRGAVRDLCRGLRITAPADVVAKLGL